MEKALKIVLNSIVALNLFYTALYASSAQPRKIPVEDFLRNPLSASYYLSPNGEYIAYLKPWKKRFNVFIRNTPFGKEKRLTEVTDRDIRSFGWVNDNFIYFMKDQGGDENFHMHLVNLDTGAVQDATPFEETKVFLVDRLENDDNRLLLSMNKRDKKIFDVYSLDLKTLKLEMVAKNPGNITDWVVDHDGQVRAAIENNGVEATILYRDTEEDEFKSLKKISFRDELSIVGFTYDNKNL